MKSHFTLDSISAAAGATLANVPLSGLVEPVQNVLIGIASALIIRFIGWLFTRK